MALVHFNYFLHDDADTYERLTYIEGEVDIELVNPITMDPTPLGEQIGRPFYEVTLKCTLDTETGEVKIVGVDQ